MFGERRVSKDLHLYYCITHEESRRGRSVIIFGVDGRYLHPALLFCPCYRRRRRLSLRNTSRAFVVKHKTVHAQTRAHDPYRYYYYTLIVIRTISIATADWTDRRRPTNAGDLQGRRRHYTLCPVLASSLTGDTHHAYCYQCIILLYNYYYYYYMILFCQRWRQYNTFPDSKYQLQSASVKGRGGEWSAIRA